MSDDTSAKEKGPDRAPFYFKPLLTDHSAFMVERMMSII